MIRRMALRTRVLYLTSVVSETREQQIMALCSKVETAQDLKEFEQAAEELRAAIRMHLAELRDRVENYGVVIASTFDSKAAD